MKLEPALLDFLKRALRTAQLLKFEDFVIEQDCVRGWNASRTAIIADRNVPELPFTGIGINRVAKLLQRLAMMDTYTLDLEIKNEFVMGLVIKGDGATMKYKCANPNAIKTPKHIKDIPTWSLEFSPVDIERVHKAQAAMNAPNLQIKSDEEGNVVLRLTDAERDTYEQTVVGHVKNIGPMSDINNVLAFDKQYDAVTLLSVLKAADGSKEDKAPEDTTEVKAPEEAKDGNPPEEAKEVKEVKVPKGPTKFTVGQGGNLSISVNGIIINVVPIVPNKVVL